MKYFVYHGTNSVFKRFKQSTVKYVGCNGDGFYFASEKSYAKTYGDIVLNCEVEITNPLTPTTKILTDSDYLKVLKHLFNDEEYKDYLKNYGWFDDDDFSSWSESMSQYFYSKSSDYQSLFDLVHTSVGSLKDLLQIVNNVTGILFDAVISHRMDEYVIFNPKQIKILSRC